MAYIVQRNHRFYVVAYDGIDPITGRERRRWHPAGESRGDAEAIAASLDRGAPAHRSGELAHGRIIPGRAVVPRRRTQLRPTTAYRYGWIIDHYIYTRASATCRCDRSYPSLDDLYADLLDHGGLIGAAFASKTVHEVHVIVRSALADATRRSSSTSTSPCSPKRHAPNPGAPADPRRGPPSSSRAFLDSAHAPAALPGAAPGRHDRDATRRDSPGCGGVTGTTPDIGCRWLAAAKRRRPLGRSSQSRPAPAADALTSTRPPRQSSPPGAPAKNTTDIPSGWPTRCSRTPRPAGARRIDQPALRPASSPAAGFPASDSTTFATPTPACSSPPVLRSRLCASASVMPTLGSPWPPTNTSSRA